MTLLELMTVVAIIGVFATLAVTNFMTFTTRQKKQGAAKEIFQSLIKARQLAITTNSPVRLVALPPLPNGRVVVRWERVGCTDTTWGTGPCPSPACSTNLCGVGGCVCPEVGPDILLPMAADFTVSPRLKGLCFLPGTGAAVGAASPTGGPFCASPGVAFNDTDLWLNFPSGGDKVFLVVERLSGLARYADCGVMPKPSPCP